MRAGDWLEAVQAKRDEVKVKKFRYTLDHLAREWYNDAVKPDWDYDKLTTEFSKYYSTQGRSLRQLHDKWRKFSFNPDTDDIEVFIRNVKECAQDLRYDDMAVLNMVKACMPSSV